MALTSRLDPRDGYLRIETTGTTPADLEDSLAYIDEICAASRQHNRPPILLDRRGVTQNPIAAGSSELLLDHTADRFIDHGYIRPSGGLDRGERLAVLVPPEHLANVLPAESLFHARGVNLHYFDSEPEAVAWLTAPRPA